MKEYSGVSELSLETKHANSGSEADGVRWLNLGSTAVAMEHLVRVAEPVGVRPKRSFAGFLAAALALLAVAYLYRCGTHASVVSDDAGGEELSDQGLNFS